MTESRKATTTDAGSSVASDEHSLTIGPDGPDAWLRTNNLPALRVPTVITPGEWNVLVNPSIRSSH
jgi:hypothetical protein